VTPAKPSLDLLRSLTDEHVLRAAMNEDRLTRAELSTRTGLSKPTVSESVRRLVAAGLLRDTGERTSGRGRIGSYYALSPDAGCALVISVDPRCIVAEVVDVHGTVLHHALERVRRPARPARVTEAIKTVAQQARAAAALPLRLAVVSAADPVDRDTGRLIHLPDAPFLIGELLPAEAVAGLVDGPVVVDNDVNWAARAERSAADEQLDDFAYLHLGEGLGCAIVADGEVRRGHQGIAGEIAHLVTTGPRGQATAFTHVFEELRLRRPGSAAIDIAAINRAIDEAADGGPAQVLSAIVEATCGVLAAIVALANPQVILIGGDWGLSPAVLTALDRRFTQSPRPVPLRPARVTTEPALTGAREHAVNELKSVIIQLSAATGLQAEAIG
jgi:predicted NBD/HSP70 family sugar kinase